MLRASTNDTELSGIISQHPLHPHPLVPSPAVAQRSFRQSGYRALQSCRCRARSMSPPFNPQGPRRCEWPSGHGRDIL